MEFNTGQWGREIVEDLGKNGQRLSEVETGYSPSQVVKKINQTLNHRPRRQSLLGHWFVTIFRNLHFYVPNRKPRTCCSRLENNVLTLPPFLHAKERWNIKESNGLENNKSGRKNLCCLLSLNTVYFPRNTIKGQNRFLFILIPF